MEKVNITDQIQIGDIDDELLSILCCACGTKFDPWDFSISIYDDDPVKCPSCGRKLFFKCMIEVYELKDEKSKA